MRAGARLSARNMTDPGINSASIRSVVARDGGASQNGGISVAASRSLAASKGMGSRRIVQPPPGAIVGRSVAFWLDFVAVNQVCRQLCPVAYPRIPALLIHLPT